MKKKKGFTLVELLAVIVILAVILVIAVPQIMSVIESARKGSIESTAKLIAEGAEREYTNRKILGKDTNIECSDVSSMNSNDYGTCVISFDNRGKATVSITGKGKFEGYTCNGNSTNMECIKGEIPGSTETAAQYFGYEENAIDEVIVKDKDKCVSYLQTNFSELAEENTNTICSGGAVNGMTLKDAVQLGGIPSSDYATAGLEVTYGISITGYNVGTRNIIVTDKDKCISYLTTNSDRIGLNEEEQPTSLCTSAESEVALLMMKIRTLDGLVEEGSIPSKDYLLAGLKVTYKNGGGTDVVIPSMIDGKKVVAIADKAFTDGGVTPTNTSNTKKVFASYLYSGNKASIHKLKTAATGLGITSVVIPNTVTSIGKYAFYDNRLVELTIPSSVKTIGENAFNQNQLTSITFPSTPITIASSAFWNNPITDDENYTYPDNVTIK